MGEASGSVSAEVEAAEGEGAVEAEVVVAVAVAVGVPAWEAGASGPASSAGECWGPRGR